MRFNWAFERVKCIGQVFVLCHRVHHPLSCHARRSLNKRLVNIYYITLHVSSTTVLIFRRAIVLTQHLVSSLSLGVCSVHRLREESSRNLCTEEPPKESDDTRCCVNIIVLLKMSIIVLETWSVSYRR